MALGTAWRRRCWGTLVVRLAGNFPSTERCHPSAFTWCVGKMLGMGCLEPGAKKPPLRTIVYFWLWLGWGRCFRASYEEQRWRGQLSREPALQGPVCAWGPGEGIWCSTPLAWGTGCPVQGSWLCHCCLSQALGRCAVAKCWKKLSSAGLLPWRNCRADHWRKTTFISNLPSELNQN